MQYNSELPDKYIIPVPVQNPNIFDRQQELGYAQTNTFKTERIIQNPLKAFFDK
jgi:hypothetical protein